MIRVYLLTWQYTHLKRLLQTEVNWQLFR